MGGLVLVDSNVLLDVLEEDPVWYGWSSEALAAVTEHSTLAINPIIFAEVSIGFNRIEEVEEALPSDVPEASPAVGSRVSSWEVFSVLSSGRR